MDIGSVLWGLWIFAFFLIEGYAIIFNKYDTLSEKIWRVGKKHWSLRVLTIIITIWAVFHLSGECALGIC